MDPQIKARMNMDVKVYPCIGLLDGDKLFGPMYTLKGYIAPKVTVIVTREGVSVTTKTSILLDGSDINRISEDDEVSIVIIGRRPIKAIIPYASFIANTYESVEVFL